MLHSLAKGWLILVLLVVNIQYIVYCFVPAEARLHDASDGTGLIDKEIGYTPQRVYEMVAAYGERGRAVYRDNILTVDIILPFLLTSFFSLAISYLFRLGFNLSSSYQLLNVIPLGAGLFDLLENVGIYLMLFIYPSTPQLLAWITTSFTMIKFILYISSLALLCVGVVAVSITVFRAKFKTR